jgi:uncharacterized protein with NRDE domain
VGDFLLSNEDPVQYLGRVSQDSERYNGFNLIVGNRDQLYWYSNKGESIVEISSGLHGISNRLLDTPWPKVTRGKQRMAELIEKRENTSFEDFFQLLTDTTPASDDILPDTGVGIEWERILSPAFIVSPIYGTRSSTLILVDMKDHVMFIDKSFNSHKEPIASAEFQFSLDA